MSSDRHGIEVVAWWNAEHLAEMPALRAECKACTDWEDLIATATDPEVANGIPKDDANYRVTDTEQNCATCGYFEVATDTCQLVAGKIEFPALAVSDLYTPIPEGRELQGITSGVERS